MLLSDWLNMAGLLWSTPACHWNVCMFSRSLHTDSCASVLTHVVLRLPLVALEDWMNLYTLDIVTLRKFWLWKVVLALGRRMPLYVASALTASVHLSCHLKYAGHGAIQDKHSSGAKTVSSAVGGSLIVVHPSQAALYAVLCGIMRRWASCYSINNIGARNRSASRVRFVESRKWQRHPRTNRLARRGSNIESWGDCRQLLSKLYGRYPSML